MSIRHIVTRGYGVAGNAGTLYVPGDADANDASVNAAVGTLGSEAKVSTLAYVFGSGGSIEFTPTSATNTNSVLTFPDSANYSIGTNTFTIDMWVRIKDLNPATGTSMTVASHYLNTGNQRAWALTLNTGTNRLVFFASDDGTTTSPAVSKVENFTWAADTWYHVAVCRDSANDVRLFVDGTQLGTPTSFNFSVHNSTTVMRVGAAKSTSDTPFYGFIDDFRFIVGEELYQGDFTPPSEVHSIGFDGDINLLPVRGYNYGVINPTPTPTPTGGGPTGGASYTHPRVPHRWPARQKRKKRIYEKLEEQLRELEAAPADLQKDAVEALEGVTGATRFAELEERVEAAIIEARGNAEIRAIERRIKMLDDIIDEYEVELLLL